MPAWIAVALLAPFLRNASIACLTSAISASAVCGGGPSASGICGTPDLSEADFLSSSLSCLSLDLPAVFLPLCLPVLPSALSDLSDLSAAACALLPRLCFAAASPARPATSRLTQASAATSADRNRRVKSAGPQSPAKRLPRVVGRHASQDLGGKAISRRHLHGWVNGRAVR